jgi:hypothetical protein
VASAPHVVHEGDEYPKVLWPWWVMILMRARRKSPGKRRFPRLSPKAARAATRAEAAARATCEGHARSTYQAEQSAEACLGRVVATRGSGASEQKGIRRAMCTVAAWSAFGRVAHTSLRKPQFQHLGREGHVAGELEELLRGGPWMLFEGVREAGDLLRRALATLVHPSAA